MNKVIIDTDIGVDDAFAIAYAAKYCDVIGITTVFGNVPVEQAVKNAKLFCEKINLNAQIYKGCSRPLAVAPMPVGTKVHGDDGMGGVFIIHIQPTPKMQFHLLLKVSKRIQGNNANSYRTINQYQCGIKSGARNYWVGKAGCHHGRSLRIFWSFR